MTARHDARMERLESLHTQHEPRDLDTLVTLLNRHKSRIEQLPEPLQVSAWQEIMRDLSDAELQMIVDAG